MGRSGHGRFALFHFALQVRQSGKQWDAFLDGVDAAHRIARMRRTTGHTDQHVHAAEAAAPYSRQRATIEIKKMALDEALFGQVAHPRIQTALLRSEEHTSELQS